MRTENKYGEAIPEEYLMYRDYAWWPFGNTIFCAPLVDQMPDWDNMCEPSDMTEFTEHDTNAMAQALELESWPAHIAAGTFNRP